MFFEVPLLRPSVFISSWAFLACDQVIGNVSSIDPKNYYELTYKEYI